MRLTPEQFVEKYYPFAKRTQDKTGIDVRFTLAQAALETGWGAKAPGNMFFGVKANPNKYPESKRQLLTTREVLNHPNATFPEIISKSRNSKGEWTYIVKDWFRRYDSPEESFTDHADMLLSNPNFEHALPYKSDAYAYTIAIQSGRKKYATDPNYVKSLHAVIRTVERYLPK